MKLQLFTKEDYHTSTWSGGSTTELYIYPAESSYRERNFQFRISSAQVELETSQFTPLPGIYRYITPLTAPLHLSYGIYGDRKLSAFQVEGFQGEWPTVSQGKATDFNLMLREIPGTMETVLLHPETSSQLSLDVDRWNMTALFPVDGEVCLGSTRVGKGQLLLLSQYGKEELLLSTPEKKSCHLIICRCRTEEA